MRLPGARRLVRAALVASVAAILLGVAVGASNAPAQAKPAVAVPTPRLGDRGAYTLVLDESYEPAPTGGPGPFPFLAFEWKPGGPARAADGRLHGTDQVQTSGWTYQGWAVLLKSMQDAGKYGGFAGFSMPPVWVRHNETLLVEQGRDEVLATDDDVHQVAYSNRTLPENPYLPSIGPSTSKTNLYQQTTVTDGRGRVFGTGEAVSCLFLNGLQNRTIVVGDQVELGRSCDLHGVLTLSSAKLRAAGVDQVHGIPAMRLEPATRSSSSYGAAAGDAISGIHRGGGTVTFWVASGIPYPVRVAWTSPGQRAATVLELAGYQPGAESRHLPVEPTGSAPPVALAAPKPWGLDEAGVHHPFPMSAAFAGARSDRNYAGLRDYLQEHPDAYVARAVYDIGAKSDTGTHRVWDFTVTDGESALDVRADRADKPDGVVGLLPVPLPIDVPAAQAANTTYRTVQMYEGGGHGLFDLYPTPADAPDALPTVASLMERWKAYASPAYAGLPPDAWGFQVMCLRVVDEDCEHAYVSSWAGHADATAGPSQPDQSSTPPTLRSNGTGHASLLAFVDNRTGALVEAVQQADTRTGVAPAPKLSPEVAGPGALVHPAATLSSWIPTPEQAVGVGAAAVAVGLLYYLWPLAKGAMGLFSRLKQPEVLSHPARQQLLQLIEAEPGIHFKEMARRTGLPNGSLVHHLETLRRGGQVVARPAGGYTLYFLGAHVPAGSAESASALKADGARKILDAVRQQPGLSSADVAARCGLQPSTVTYHVQRLQAAGLLTGLRDGRSVRLHPVESGAAA